MRISTYELAQNYFQNQIDVVEPIIDFGNSCALNTEDGVTTGYKIKEINIFQGKDFRIYNKNKEIEIDIMDTTFEDGSIGTLFCIDILEHIPDPIKASKEICRVLKSNGTCFISTPWEFPYQKENEYAPYKDYYRYSPHALRYLFNDLNIVQCDWEPRDNELMYMQMDRFGEVVGAFSQHNYFVTGSYLIAKKL